MPTSPGYLVNGPETANMIVGVGTYGYNFCQYTNLAYLSNAYLCYRGSVNWTFNPVTTGVAMPEMRVTRNNVSGFTNSYATVSILTTTKSLAARGFMNGRYSAGTGQAITNCLTNAGCNVQCPMYSSHKFQYTVPTRANLGVVGDGSILDQYTLEMIAKTDAANPATSVMVNNYVGVGTDFSLHFFLNVPTLYLYSSVPTGV